MSSPRDGAGSSADAEGTPGDPTITVAELKAMVDAEDEVMTAVFGASDERNCSYPNGYAGRQALFACRDCCESNVQAGICLACAMTCHGGHDLVELYTKRKFRCDCGNSKFERTACRLCPEKEFDNPDNPYNHNFFGKYCVCDRPYPSDVTSEAEDGAEEENEEMLQCVICEDWYHLRHIGVSAPEAFDDDDNTELVCPACLVDHRFIEQYAWAITKSEELSPSSCRLETIKKLMKDDKSIINVDDDDKPGVVMSGEWRHLLCRCIKCIDLYNAEKVNFLLDSEDTLESYEAAGRAKIASDGQGGDGSSSGGAMADRLVAAALGSIKDRVVATEVAHGYSDLKTSFESFLKDVSKRKRVLTEDDVKEFFDDLNEKRKRYTSVPDNPSSSSSKRRGDGGDSSGAGGSHSNSMGTPPSSCHGPW